MRALCVNASTGGKIYPEKNTGGESDFSFFFLLLLNFALFLL